jgi:hypothetical protein
MLNRFVCAVLGVGICYAVDNGRPIATAFAALLLAFFVVWGEKLDV